MGEGRGEGYQLSIMDFFERQEKAQRNTKLLVVYFMAGMPP
jgi:hypothetical protein